MSKNNVVFARLCLLISGIMLLGETLLGCIYVLGIGFSTTRDIITDLCLTMAFPVFLTCFKSLKLAVCGLWSFFLIQWMDVCCNRATPGFTNPLGWLHGDLLFASSIMVTIALTLLSSRDDKRSPATFGNAFDMEEK